VIIIDSIEQGSAAWFALKNGVISASRACEFSTESKLAPLPDDITYVKAGKEHVFNYGDLEFRGTNKLELTTAIRQTIKPIYGDMRQSYMAELVGQVATGIIPEQMSFKQCEWGHKYEDEARAFFELETGHDVTVPAFIYRDDKQRFGLSPDGLITGLVEGKRYGLELKCPFTTRVFVEFVTCDKIKKEYLEQCQYSMWITGYNGWYFAKYDPRVKSHNLHYVLIERDQKYMDKYNKAEPAFIRDMDIMLEKMGVSFGDQWVEGDT
jgi:hypothetical protein